MFDFKKVLFTLNLKKNLISGPLLNYKGLNYISKKGKVKVSLKPNNETLFTGTLKNVCYLFPKYSLHKPPEYHLKYFPDKANFEAFNVQIVTCHRKMTLKFQFN